MSLQAKLTKVFTRRVIKRHGLNEEQLVRHLRRAFNHVPVPPLFPRGIRKHKIDAKQFRGDHLRGRGPARVTLLYLHGGGYVAGVTRTYHNLSARLAKQLDGEVYLPTYPLAPEHPYPAPTNRVFEAYQYLLDQGKDPTNIVIAGDSAGGGLTLATLLRIRDEGLPAPRCAVVISPATTCFSNQAEMQARDDSDAMLSADMINALTHIYVPDPDHQREPYASPALGDYTGVPPVMMTMSCEEVMYADAVTTRDSMRDAGVTVEWLERRGLFHVWPVAVPFLPEANRDLKRIVAFIRAQAR